MPVSRHGLRIVTQQSDIVVDMLQHVYHQQEFLRNLADGAPETNLLSVVYLAELGFISCIDANGASANSGIQQLARKYACARSHIEYFVGRKALQ